MKGFGWSRGSVTLGGPFRRFPSSRKKTMKIPSLLLLALLAGCRSTEPKPELDTSRPSRTFGFVYGTSVQALPAGTTQVRVWIPVPIDTLDQTIQDVRLRGLAGNTSFEIPSEEFERGEFDGEKGGVQWSVRDFRSGTGRSLCMTTSKPVELEMTFEVTRYETHGGGRQSQEELQEYLEADSMIPLGGKVSEIAAGLPARDDPDLTARELYDHTLERMKYDKPDGGKWGRGDAEWACESRYGNCTDFHSYFMGLARTKGIPARFEMGFSVPGGDDPEEEIAGYHCWAFYWSEDQGWIPVDISEADKHPEKAEYFFGTLDYDRVTLTEGRDIELDPKPAAGTINFFVYPYVEVDGSPWSNVKRSFKRFRL